MAQGDSANGGSIAAIDSEWEYEYSQDETEDLYFILDFPIPVEPEVEPTVTKRCVIKFPSQESASPTDRERSVSPEWTPDQGVVHRTSVKDAIQIADLHSRQPLIAYKRQVYSCNWASTMGTDMLFSRPLEGEQQSADPPSRLVATTAVKLVAKPVDVRLKEPNVVQSSSAQEANVSTQVNGASRDAKAQKQVEFLERLQAAKRKRGEADTVPMEPILTLKRPVDWIDQEKHDQARREHEDRKRKHRPADGTPKTPRKKKPKGLREKSQAARPSPRKPMGRPPGRTSNRVLRNLLGFTTGRRRSKMRSDGGENENDSAPVSTPTPSYFEFVESEDGQRIARVPQEP